MADIRDFLAKLAVSVGLKASDAQRMEALADKLVSTKASNVDRLEQVKDEIRGLEARAGKKKDEYDKSRGDVKKIVEGEIERTFREIDRLQDLVGIISANIERISVLQAKLKEIRGIDVLRGASEEELDAVALRAQEAFADLERVDSAAQDLEKERYKAPERESVDIEERISQMKEPAKEEGLSPAIMKRLKETKPEKE